MRKYKTLQDRRAARLGQVRAAGLKRKAARQAAAGVLPLWKVAAMIEAAIAGGFTFDEAWEAVQFVAAENGLHIRRDINEKQRG